MTDLSPFPITAKWPAQHPDRLQLYSLPTPNGVKVSVMLEETGLPYEPHLVRFDTNDQLTPEFLSLNTALAACIARANDRLRVGVEGVVGRRLTQRAVYRRSFFQH